MKCDKNLKPAPKAQCAIQNVVNLLLCVNKNGYIGITKGYRYKVTSEDNLFYYITNDQGEKNAGYTKDCFIAQ